ncbi:MAG: Gfo/Idh/MocA family oxidoreductase [Clostridiales bacterium]|nr:Gfo/Idh/MocA family oxidoreductase [Clostridiales bacterium]
MYRIGVVNIDTSHPKAFSDYLRKGDRARYTAVFNEGFRGDDEVEGFMYTNSIGKRHYSLSKMAEDVDIGFIHGCNWNKHLSRAKAFIEAGKPVFIDKPIAGNLRDCLELECLAASGAKIYGSSSLRYAEEVTSFLAQPEDERGKIVHITATVGVDEFNYAIHAVETIMGLVGFYARAESVTYIGRTGFPGAECDSYFVRFKDGVSANYHIYLNCWQASTMTVITTKKTVCGAIAAGVAYGALLDRVCDALDGDESGIAPVESLTESIKIMLAGRSSRLKGGVPVRICELTEADEGFDGDLFEIGYAAAARKLYITEDKK